MIVRNYINRIFFLLFVFLCATQVFAQVSYVSYYGKNKVQYGKFNWNIYKTEHFKLFHYIDNPQILKNIAEMAESAYQKISQDIKHALSVSITRPTQILSRQTFFLHRKGSWVSQSLLCTGSLSMEI